MTSRTRRVKDRHRGDRIQNDDAFTQYLAAMLEASRVPLRPDNIDKAIAKVQGWIAPCSRMYNRWP